MSESYGDDYGCTLLVSFEPYQVAGIKQAAAAARMSVSAFIHRAVAGAVPASPPAAEPAIGTMSSAAASPANKPVD